MKKMYIPEEKMPSLTRKERAKESDKNDKDYPLEDYGCGYGNCYPSCLQICANIKTYTLNMALVTLLHGTYYSYFIGTLRTLEKRYALSSKQTGFLTSTNDIVQLFFVLSIAYAARTANKARVLSCVVFFTVLANLLLASPYFVFGPKAIERGAIREPVTKLNVTVTSNTSQFDGLLCSSDPRQDPCLSEDKTVEIGAQSGTAFILLALGCMVIGIGGSSNSTMGITYIEDNCKKNQSSLYIGMVIAMYPWGPIIGYSLAALCTGLPEGLTDTSLSQKDPNFIGAWWVGYVAIACTLFLAIIPMFFFPKYLKSREVASIISDDGKEKNQKKVGESGIASRISEFVLHFKGVISNKILWCHVLSQVFRLYVIVGVLIQQPRFLEAHYHMSTSMASLITGCASSITGILGTLLGSYVMKKLKLKLNGIAIMVILAALAAAAGSLISMFFACPAVNMVGQLNPQTQNLDLEYGCNFNCTCDKVRMEPICAGGSLTYFSACYAGCKTYGNGTVGDCSCIPPGVPVTAGICETSCNMLIPYIINCFIVSFLATTGNVPSTIITLRVVEEEMRSFALGLGGTLSALLVFIPGPILFGAIVDSTCLIWQESCEDTGACLFYDITRLRVLPHGVTLCFQVIGIIFSLFAWRFILLDPTIDQRYKNDAEDLQKGITISEEQEMNETELWG